MFMLENRPVSLQEEKNTNTISKLKPLYSKLIETVATSFNIINKMSPDMIKEINDLQAKVKNKKAGPEVEHKLGQLLDSFFDLKSQLKKLKNDINEINMEISRTRGQHEVSKESQLGSVVDLEDVSEKSFFQHAQLKGLSFGVGVLYEMDYFISKTPDSKSEFNLSNEFCAEINGPGVIVQHRSASERFLEEFLPMVKNSQRLFGSVPEIELIKAKCLEDGTLNYNGYLSAAKNILSDNMHKFAEAKVKTERHQLAERFEDVARLRSDFEVVLDLLNMGKINDGALVRKASSVYAEINELYKMNDSIYEQNNAWLNLMNSFENQDSPLEAEIREKLFDMIKEFNSRAEVVVDKVKELESSLIGQGLNRSNQKVDEKKAEQDFAEEKNNQPEAEDIVEQSVSQDTKSQTLRQKFEVNKEEEFDKLLSYYAQVNKQYYSGDGKKKTGEEIKKRKNINAQFKRILENKAKQMSKNENGEEFSTTISSIEKGEIFSNDEIKQVAENKGATLKLFEIMASGVYEKNGVRTRLTQKQRIALASTLEIVSEMRLDMDKTKKISKTVPENTQESSKTTVLGDV